MPHCFQMCPSGKYQKKYFLSLTHLTTFSIKVQCYIACEVENAISAVQIVRWPCIHPCRQSFSSSSLNIRNPATWTVNLEPWNWENGAGWEVWCLPKASSSLKTRAVPSFYKTITDNQSAKLVYNLTYSKDRGSSFERRGYWSRLLLRFGYLLRDRADNGAW